MEKIINWFKTLFKIVRHFDSNNQAIWRNINENREVIRERTDIHVDVSPHQRSHHQIIITGQYKNRDYVEIFSVKTQDLEELIHILRNMQEHGRIRTFDEGPVHIRRTLNSKLDL